MGKGRQNALSWLLEPLEGERGYLEKPMFGCLACYLHGRLMLVLADKEDPWDGLLVPTGRESHESLMGDFPALSPHPVLGKWLWIAASHPDFEETATGVVELAMRDDRRLGVEPDSKRGSRKKTRG